MVNRLQIFILRIILITSLVLGRYFSNGVNVGITI